MNTEDPADRQESEKKPPSAAFSKAWMLGPKAENQDFFERLFLELFRDCCYWRRNFHPEDDPYVSLDDRLDPGFSGYQDRLHDELQRLIARLRSGVPFFNPRYVGHMLTDQFMAGFLGYAAAMFHNQNTLVQEVAPGTLEFEGEAMRQIGVMLGLDADGWGHLCAGGTAANMEAIWIARNVRLFPYLLRKAIDDASEAVKKKLKDLPLTPDQAGPAFGQRLDGDGLHTLTIKQIIHLHKSLKAYLVKGKKDTDEELVLKASVAGQVQKWSPAKLGLVNALCECGPDAPRFKVLIGKNAHYSLLKAVGLIGLGEDDVIKIDSVYEADAHDADRMPLRMDLVKLREALAECDRNGDCILAVVGVYGTTEVAAVDPFHEIVAIREERLGKKCDFWLHADACYGGYAAAMLHGGNEKAKELAAFLRDLAARTGTSHLLDKESGATVGPEDRLQARFVKHTLALSECDSISLDPHKLGYIPYPAGAILFRDRVVREMIKYEAPYLNAADQDTAVVVTSAEDVMFPDEPREPDKDEPVKERIPWYESEMSSYTLEGSRPGASAAAVYLAHKTIPLNQEGHGTMVGQTILGAWKLIRVLSNKLKLDSDNANFGVAFLNPEPDLNIVCYTFPGQFKLRDMNRPVPIPLAVVNEAVRRLYQEFLPTAAHPMPTRDFVIAKTALSYDKYKEGLATIWKRLSGSHEFDLVGRPAPHNQLTTKANPWRDDSEIVLVRTAIMGPFFLSARSARHEGKSVDLAELYGEKLQRTLLRLVETILDAPLPENRRPRLPAPVLIVEDHERDRKALLEQFTPAKSVDFQLARDGLQRQMLGSAKNSVDAVAAAKAMKAKAALVDVHLGEGEEARGGMKFLEHMLSEEHFRGAVVFTSLKGKLDREQLERLQEQYQSRGKLLKDHDKPDINSRYYQARLNLVLADLWQILLLPDAVPSS